MSYSTVLFDLDHTLFDSARSEIDALYATFGANQVMVSDDVLMAYHRINRSLWDRLERGELGVNRLRVQRFEELVAQQSLGADPIKLADDYSYWLGQCGDLYDGALELLRALEGRVSLGLVTNGVSSTQRARVARHGLDRYFTSIVVSGEFGGAKPQRAIFDEALDQLGVSDRREVLMVGDSVSSDIRGAHGADLAACWYNPAGDSPPADVTIRHVVRDLASVERVVVGDGAPGEFAPT